MLTCYNNDVMGSAHAHMPTQARIVRKSREILLKITIVMSNLVQCFFCQSFKGTTFAAVVRHIGSVHSHEPGFSISCGIKDCPRRSTRPYNNFASYKKHLYRHHPDVLNQTIHPAVAENDETQNADPELHPINPCDDISDPSEHGNGLQESHSEQLKRSAALFILKTAEVRKLTLTAVNGVLEDVQELVERAVHGTHTKVCSVLHKAGISASDVPELHDLFTDENLLNPFMGLQTEHLQVKYFKEKFGYIVSCM